MKAHKLLEGGREEYWNRYHAPAKIRSTAMSCNVRRLNLTETHTPVIYQRTTHCIVVIYHDDRVFYEHCLCSSSWNLSHSTAQLLIVFEVKGIINKVNVTRHEPHMAVSLAFSLLYGMVWLFGKSGRAENIVQACLSWVCFFGT